MWFFVFTNLNKYKYGAIIEDVIYCFIKGLYRRIPDCKLAMHANCINVIQKAWFMILAADTMVVAIDGTDSTANAITASDICVFTQMVLGER